jgi:hypothetical protein
MGFMPINRILYDRLYCSAGIALAIEGIKGIYGVTWLRKIEPGAS